MRPLEDLGVERELFGELVDLASASEQTVLMMVVFLP